MTTRALCILCAAVLSLIGVCDTQAQTAKELIGDTKVGNVSSTMPRQVGMLLWGGEGATIWANGGITTTPDSIYGKAGLNYQLTDANDPIQAARDYLSGKTPYFRGTFMQACLFSEVFNEDPRTKPVFVGQMTYSLGDHMVYKEPDANVKDNGNGTYSIIKPTQLQDLNGRKIRIAAQRGGPHLSMLDDSFRAGGFKWTDIEMVWTKNLTGPDSPAEALRTGKCDIACVITPDMIGLCSGANLVGSGAEGTVKGARVINTTATMSRSIADCYFCRADFYNEHRDEVEKFFVGYLQASRDLVAARKSYNEGTTVPQYQTVMEQLQKFFGEDALPTIEEDVHGLLLDANFVQIPGNEVFLRDNNNLAGFAAKQTAGLEVAKNLGYINQKLGFATADWDFKDISSAAGIAYVKPVYSTGRIKAEVSDFMEDLDSDTVFSFTISFEANETEFPVETYAADFKRFCEAYSSFGNAAIIPEGHGDPTLALKHFFWAAKAKGLITGDGGNYQFNGQPLNLTDTDSVIQVIQQSNLAGQKRENSAGQVEEIPDPRETVAAALALSQTRAKNVKVSLQKFATDNGYQIDFEAIFPRGVGIADPVVSRPTNITEAKKNMRVVFRVVKVKAEAITEDDFDFGN